MLLKQSLMHAAYNSLETRKLFLVNDIEVGVYLSAAGGAEAGWHYDNNHNVTIQLYGSKDWHTMPSGNPNVISSRGMADPPRNAHEQRDVVPSPASATCTRLTPGAAIYVPPGHWHRVVPVEDDPRCLSVDIRVASATQARWVCEELFAGMMHGGAAVQGERS
jgi:ribosomal protein L16 Arg81 hydroxylase